MRQKHDLNKAFNINLTKAINKEEQIAVNISYNDDCKNGHNSFHITGDITSIITGEYISSGCIHDDIIKAYPKLNKYIKWHYMTQEQPLHYVANTLHYSKTRKRMDLPLNAPLTFEPRLKFDNIPFTFKEHTKGFFDYLKNVSDFDKIEVIEVFHPDNPLCYSSNYSLTDFNPIGTSSPMWYAAPFKTLLEATEFLEALRTHKFAIIQHPTSFNQSIASNLEAARNCAIWPDATLEQLQSEELLFERLPALMNEFSEDLAEIFNAYN